MGALLFRHRLSVMLGAFIVALLSAALASKVGPDAPAWARPVWALFGGVTELDVASTRRDMGLFVTGVLCLFAFGLRTWGEAWLGAAVYGQGETERLVDGGPFARSRNPLYLGTWTFFFALVAFWAPWWLWLGLSALFFWALDQMVRHEEGVLLGILGTPYRDYLGRVGRWWPSGGASPSTMKSTPRGSAWAAGALANLGLASMGLYRVGVALGAPAKGLGAVNLLCLLVWLGVVGYRRSRRR